MSEWAIRSKKQLFAHLLIFGERPERFAHILIKKEGMSRSLVFYLKNLQKTNKKRTKKYDISQIIWSESLTVAHLSWVIWGNRSQSLIWSERWANEQIPNPDFCIVFADLGTSPVCVSASMRQNWHRKCALLKIFSMLWQHALNLPRLSLWLLFSVLL